MALELVFRFLRRRLPPLLALALAGCVPGGVTVGGYESTDQGKVVMGAMIDALNQLIPLVSARKS